MGRDWRGFLLKLRWGAARALTPRRTVHARGLRFTLPCVNWVTHYRWQSYNTKEPETLDWIDRWMREGDLLFDVGANIGLYAIYAALRHPGARVIAVEPEYANLCLLKENILANGLQEQVEAYSVALSNVTGVSYLHLQDVAAGSALHSESRHSLAVTQAGRPVVWREGVTTMTLDLFCEQTGQRPHCLKIDVDGTEPIILEGASQTLQAPSLRSILVELPDPQIRQQCAARLEGAGFSCHWRDPHGRSANEIWVREGGA